MRPYRAIASARFRLLLQYRAAAWAGIATQLFWGLIRTMVFEAFYRSSRAPQPMSLSETITYIWLGQALLAIVMLGVESEVRDTVRSGAVAYDLCRPVDLYSVLLIRNLAYRGATTALRAGPQLVLAACFLGLRLPPSPAALLAFGLATVMALLLASAWANLLTALLFFTVAGDGVVRLGTVLPWLLSGIVIPLPLLPDWWQAVAGWQPFAGLADLPFRLWIGHLPPAAVGQVLVFQAAWLLGFVLLGRLLLARGLRRLVVLGG
ncbi:MAG: ABC-2 family transporter protein [Fimbriimonadaceae bacterium]|nr:ABC-2 family transporter protein [Fimbriimonadaceae bacterium]